MMHVIRGLSAAALALGCAACSFLGPQKEETRFAVLASIDDLDPPTAAPPASAEPVPSSEGSSRSMGQSSRSVGLGPVTLPDYVRRTSIVTRRGETHLVPSDTERWAEPVERAVERVMALDLARVLGVARVAHYPWYETERPDAQVAIAFSRFERDEAGQVVVTARWSVRTFDEKQPPVEHEFHVRRPASGSDGASAALAMSQSLADLAREIARAYQPERPTD